MPNSTKNVSPNNFDFLRMLFAFTVMVAHIIVLSGVEAFKPYLVFFDTPLAIRGFFIVSGFLVYKSYCNSSGLKDYFIRRARRILPLYVLLIIVMAFGFVTISEDSATAYFGSSHFWKYLVANLSFQNYIEPTLPGVFTNNLSPAVNGSLWTLKVEEGFYILLPLLVWLIKKVKLNMDYGLIAVYLVSVTVFYFLNEYLGYRFAKQLPGILSYFVSGILLFRHLSWFKQQMHFLIVPALLLFTLDVFFLSFQVFKPFCLGIMVIYLAYNFKFLNGFGKYGDFTYGMYIFHFPMVQIAYANKLFINYNPILVATGIIIAATLLAVASWHFYETKFLSKQRLKRQIQ